MGGCSGGHVQIAVINNVPMFFQERDGPWFPTLRILHQYPGKLGEAPGVQGLVGAGMACAGAHPGLIPTSKHPHMPCLPAPIPAHSLAHAHYMPAMPACPPRALKPMPYLLAPLPLHPLDPQI